MIGKVLCWLGFHKWDQDRCTYPGCPDFDTELNPPDIDSVVKRVKR